MKYAVLLGYLLWIFILQSAVMFLPPQRSAAYLSVAIFAMGASAIVCRKIFDGGKIADMGFRLNRKALIGMGIAFVYTLLILSLNYWLPWRLGFINLVPNEHLTQRENASIIPVLLATIIFGGGALFLGALFGEELTFRGYVLPRFGEIFSSAKATVLCSAIFALWHLPVYFSIYTKEVISQDWTRIGIMLIAHGVSSIPLCILYLTTEELYGVSLFHALADIFQYAVVGNPAFGDAAGGAIYELKVIQNAGFSFINWSSFIVGIIAMFYLCAALRRYVAKGDVK